MGQDLSFRWRCCYKYNFANQSAKNRWQFLQTFLIIQLNGMMNFENWCALSIHTFSMPLATVESNVTIFSFREYSLCQYDSVFESMSIRHFHVRRIDLQWAKGHYCNHSHLIWLAHLAIARISINVVLIGRSSYKYFYVIL